MNLKHLETFYWAARLGSFTKAAEKLSATHSTISSRIREVESDVGVMLFDRSHRSAHLTAKGNELLTYVEKILNTTSEMRRSISGPESVAGFVRIGIVEVVSFTWMPKLVRALNQRYPKIEIEIDVNLTKNIVNKLRAGTLDLILAPWQRRDIAFEASSLGFVQFNWAIAPAVRMPKALLRASDLQQWPIIVLSRESYHHGTIEKWFHANGGAMRRVFTCSSLNAVASLTMAGLGVGFLPPSCYRREIREKRLRVLRTDPPVPAVEYFAITPVSNIQPIARLVASLAAEVSAFPRNC